MAYSRLFLAMTLLAATSSAAPNGKKVDLKVPEECKGKGFCSIKPDGYDEIEDLINSLLPKHLAGLSIADRIGDESESSELSPENDWHNCPYRKSTESKYLFSSPNDTKTDILIQTKLLYQPVEIVTCAYDKVEDGASDQCFQHLKLSSFSMQTRCKTSTATRILFVFDAETHEIKRKKYDVPCCCTCQITYD